MAASFKLYWGWVVCFTFLLIFTVTAGIAFSFSEIMVPLNREMHSSVTFLSWLGSMPVSLPMLAAPVGTMMHYRYGCQKTVFMGVFILAIALSITPLVDDIAWMFITYGVLASTGLLLIVQPPFFLLDDYFPYDHPKHVLATSIIACGFPLATLIFNPVTYLLLDAVGWRITYSIYGAMVFLTGSVTALTFRSKKGGDDEVSIIGPEDMQDPENDQYQSSNKNPTQITRQTELILGSLWLSASILKCMGYYTPFVTLVKQMDVLGIPQSESSKAMAVIGACEVVSRLATSYVGDYFKGKILIMYVVCTLALCIQNALGSLATEFTELVIYAAALGVFGGPIIAAMYSSCSEVMCGHNVPALFSIFRVGLGIGSLIGPTLAGAVFDTTQSFHLVFYINAGAYFGASVLYLFIIFLNRLKPKWCFPDIPEEITLSTTIKSAHNHNTFKTDTQCNGHMDSVWKSDKDINRLQNGDASRTDVENPLYEQQNGDDSGEEKDLFAIDALEQ